MQNKKIIAVLAVFAAAASAVGAWVISTYPAGATYHFSNFEGHPPIHVRRFAEKKPAGLAPAIVKSIYKLPSAGGNGTIAIVDAYDNPTIENDLSVFDKEYHLPDCTVKNGCFEKT